MYDVNHLVSRHKQEMSQLKKSLYTSLAREKSTTSAINKKFEAICENGFEEPQAKPIKLFSAFITTLAMIAVIFIA